MKVMLVMTNYAKKYVSTICQSLSVPEIDVFSVYQNCIPQWPPNTKLKLILPVELQAKESCSSNEQNADRINICELN